MLQLESYQLPGYRRWMSRNRDRLLKNCVLVGLVGTILSWYLPVFFSLFITERARRESVANWVMLALFLAVSGGAGGARFARAPAKKTAGVHAPRAPALRLHRAFVSGRLGAFVADLPAAVSALRRQLLYRHGRGGAGAAPGESYQRAVLRAGAQKAGRQAGSDQDRHHPAAMARPLPNSSCATYSRRNTACWPRPPVSTPPWGSRAVINEQLKSEHQIFIAEMGARHVGDIKELCELVHPKYGLLTSVGPQHLETFGSIENIAGTKYELIEALPKDGIAFFLLRRQLCGSPLCQVRAGKVPRGLQSRPPALHAGHGYRGQPAGQPLHPQVRRRRIAALPHAPPGQAQHPEHRPLRGPWPANWA